jgi:MFS family permease
MRTCMPPDAWTRSRWRMLAVLALAELLGMSLWFTANAAGPELRQRWNLDPGQLGWLTAVVQLGFVAGTATAALLNLADLWPARAYFAGCALLAGASNLVLLSARDYSLALLTQFGTGFFLAGVYPTAMKMAATWFRSSRGLAIGIVVGALCVGKSLPYLAHAAGGASLRSVTVATSAAAALAAILVASLYHDGPFPFERRPFDWALVARVIRHRETRLVLCGYLGHMWELYAMWTWVPAFIAASLQAGARTHPAWTGDLAACGALAAGGLGCVWGGWAARTRGSARVAMVAMAASGVCSLGVGLFFDAGFWVLAPLVWLWGFFVVADSAQFSALVTDAAPRHAVGTALTLQTSLGFLLTMASIQLVPVLVSAAGWRWAFLLLAPGPALGIAAIARLGSGRAAPGTDDRAPGAR